MTTEYNCSCHIKGITYELLTCGAVTTHDAIAQLKASVQERGGDFARADGLVIDLIDVD